MEFIIDKFVFLEILNKVQGITQPKSNMPILSNILIEAKSGNELQIVATDIKIGFVGQYSTEVIIPGKITIPSNKLYEIVREFPKENIHIKELENKWIQVVDESVKYNIVGMDPEEYPSLSDITDIDFLKIEADVLKKMIDRTIFSVLTGEGYVEMTGINLEQEKTEEKNILRMISTDGHRISFVETELDISEPCIFNEGIIIPKKGIVEAAKLLETEDKVLLGIKENKFVLKKDMETVITRIIEGEFPDCKNIVPSDNKYSLIVDRAEFLKMVRRMSIFSSDKYRSVKFRINNNFLEIVNTNPELGESNEMAAIKYDGDALEIGFNPKYFIDTLNNMKSEKICIKLKDGESSCLITGDEDKDFVSVIMPMRV